MIAIEIDAQQLTRLKAAVGKAGKKFSKEIAGAINDVSKKTRLEMGRGIREHVKMSKVESEKTLKMSSKATETNLSVTVSLRSTRRPRRPGLQHFNAKQNKKGVTYRVSATKGKSGKGFVAGAFMGPSPGKFAPKLYGGVFKRVGKSRLPVVRLHGVSAYGAYVKNELSGPQAKQITDDLKYQMERRIKFNILRAEGLIKH
jgi:hypothetical protein